MDIKKLLLDLGIKHQINEFIASSETKMVNDTLYYKNVPSALLYLNHLDKHQSKISDDGFKVKGTMIDLSRNAVFNLAYFKEVILKQALLGFNEIWLYIEDVYELEDYKKFGYLRGKYSLEDIKTLDAYALSLGVTLVPCMQTLGHMSQFLRWPSSSKFKDQHDVLIIADQTYDFIKAMLNFCKQAFKTDKIHVGMDETFGFSFGQYYKQNGYTSPEGLFIAHLNKVHKIAKELGFGEVCIWSDMFFRHRSKVNYYYDLNITFEDAFLDQIPEDITLVYWDYYNKEANIYYKMIKNHLAMKRKVIMASGTWIWTKLAYDQQKTLLTATHAIQQSKANQIDEIIFTQWNDDGSYCNYETSFLGLLDVTNVMLTNKVSNNYLSTIHTISYEKMMAATYINQLGYEPVLVLWDDLLLGIYLNDIVGYDKDKLKPLIEKTESFIKMNEEVDFDYYVTLGNLLKNKLQLRSILLEGYFNQVGFKGAYPILENMKLNLLSFLTMFEKNWNERNKMFGLEIIQNRLFGQLRRIETYKSLIDGFKLGDKLEFLEESLIKEPYTNLKFIDIAFSSKQ